MIIIMTYKLTFQVISITKLQCILVYEIFSFLENFTYNFVYFFVSAH